MNLNIKSKQLFALALCVLIATSCLQEYDFERENTPTDSLGHELFLVWKKDAARAPQNADSKVQMLEENYINFVDAVDAIAPEAELTEIDNLLVNLMKLVDEGILPAISRKLRAILDEAILDDVLLQALATPSGPDPETFVDPTAQSNFFGHASGFPQLTQFLGLVARIATGNDGITNDGVRTFDEPSAISDLTRVLVRELREASASGEEPLAVTIRDLALEESEKYTADEPLPPVWVVLYDERGFPLAATDNGEVQYPFVDDDGDGLADLNGAGEFVYRNGGSGKLEAFRMVGSIDEPVIRDAWGRAEVPGGFAFQYVDIHSTGLGFLVHEFLGLSSQDTLYDMLVAFQQIMGQKTVHTDEIGAFEGYPADQPLSQLSHAAVSILDTPILPDVLGDFADLLEQEPDVLAKLMFELDKLLEILNKYPLAEMGDDQTMAYDVLPILLAIAEDRQLWADVMKAFEAPIFTKTGEAMGMMVRYKDNDTTPVADGAYDSCFMGCEGSFEIGTISRYECIRKCPNTEIFNERMDYSAPESERGRSLFQKFLHLLRDTGGVPYSMVITEASLNGTSLPDLPPIIVLEGAGESFLASIAGNLDLGETVPPSLWASDLGDLLDLLGVSNGDIAGMLSALSPLFGAQLDVMAKPHQITRLFNQTELRFETDSIKLAVADPVCKDGFVMSQHLAYGLFVAEAAGMIDAIHPIAVAFSDNGQESLFANLMNVLHNHYTSNPALYKTAAGGESSMKGGNLRSYEEALNEIFSDDGLFVALHEFSLALKSVEASTGKPMTDDLRLLLLSALKKDGYKTHGGDDFINIDDGRTIANPSRIAVIIHAVGEASKRLDEVPETRARLRSSVGNVMDVMVGAEKDTAGIPRFKRTGSPAITVHAARYLENRAREKQADGEFSTWVNVDLVEMLEDLWTSRLLASLVDLAANTLENEADKALIDDFTAYLLGSTEGRTHVLLFIHQFLVASVNEEVWLPVARFMADAIDPDRAWETEPFRDVPLLTLGAQMLEKTIEYDPSNTGIFLIHRGLLKPAGSDTPFDVIVDMVAAYFSPDPLAEQLQSAEDYRHFMGKLSDYIGDDLHGIERLYELVSRRQR